MWKGGGKDGDSLVNISEVPSGEVRSIAYTTWTAGKTLSSMEALKHLDALESMEIGGFGYMRYP